MKAERCPICDQGTLKRELNDKVFEYGGDTVTIPDYVVYRCSACNDAVVDNETLKTSGHILNAFKNEVDARRESKSLQS
jgi:YgiT-type zinc finger domain-containing protein